MKTIDEVEYRELCQEVCRSGVNSKKEFWKRLHQRFCQELAIDGGLISDGSESEVIYVWNLMRKLNASKAEDFDGLAIASEYLAMALK